MLQEDDPGRPLHQPHAARLDQLPGLLQLPVGDPADVGGRGVVGDVQQREAPLAVDSGDEPRRRSAESSAPVVEEQRTARGSDVPQPVRVVDVSAQGVAAS